MSSTGSQSQCVPRTEVYLNKLSHSTREWWSYWEESPSEWVLGPVFSLQLFQSFWDWHSCQKSRGNSCAYKCLLLPFQYSMYFLPHQLHYEKSIRVLLNISPKSPVSVGGEIASHFYFPCFSLPKSWTRVNINFFKGFLNFVLHLTKIGKLLNFGYNFLY